ncbi:MAG: hypothetical protein Q8Q91_02580 [Candidatus Daviesbacteria bacterium]|nr:hypothetical protein [Candidatus Daviesbacteria bacterium]
MDHKTEALIATCIDFRLQEAINNWIAQNFSPKTFDRVALAGGVKNLVVILSQIDIAVKLHHIKKAVLINHEDCGAYGAEGTQEKHSKDLQKAKEKILSKFPDLSVETYYLKLDGTFVTT